MISEMIWYLCGVIFSYQSYVRIQQVNLPILKEIFESNTYLEQRRFCHVWSWRKE